ncbi:hypothetical protein AX16_002930 [Volvariella volvacea WC 439]|nr:hypothetical protein AX16_002930 [Volvariella volvacea WC 439]
MEEAVLAWKGARAQILGLIKERDKARAEDEETTERPHKRLKRSREGETMIVEDSDTEWMVGPSSLRLGSVSPQKAKLKPTKLKPVPTPIPSSDVEESGDDIRTRQDNGSDVDVQCPLCQKDVKMSKINAHMDSNCQDVSEESRAQKHQWAQILGKHDRSKKGKDRESNNNNDRLPKVSYSTLKDRQLRDMLQEHELPTTGDRPTHERRHQHWVMLYNANLDRSISNRKSLQELRRELKQWEQQRTNRKKVQPPGDLKAYEKSHQAEFARLTEAARPKTKQNSVTPGSVTADPSQLDRDGPAPST